MKTGVLLLVVSLTLLVAIPVWAQQQNPDADLLAQLEKRLAELCSGYSVHGFEFDTSFT